MAHTKPPRIRFMTLMMALCFSITAQSCVFTVYNWKGVPFEIANAEQVEALTPSEKERAFKRYAIDTFKLTSTGHLIGFSTYLEPDITYDLYTYVPIITAFSPESAQTLEDVLWWETLGKYTGYGFLSAGVFYGAIAGEQLLQERIALGVNANNNPANLTQFNQNLNTLGWVYSSESLLILPSPVFLPSKK